VPERRRAIQEHDVVVLADALEAAFESLMGAQRARLGHPGLEVVAGWQYVDVLDQFRMRP
jgi:hypothetical protein